MDSARRGQIVNRMTGKCLTALPWPPGTMARLFRRSVKETTRKCGTRSEWGTRFKLIAKSTLCAEVKDQKPGERRRCAPARLQFRVESALVHRSFAPGRHELLYQSDLDKHTWQEKASHKYPYAGQCA